MLMKWDFKLPFKLFYYMIKKEPLVEGTKINQRLFYFVKLLISNF